MGFRCTSLAFDKVVDAVCMNKSPVVDVRKPVQMFIAVVLALFSSG